MKKEFWIYRILNSYYLYNKDTYSKEAILSGQLDTFDILLLPNNFILPDSLRGMGDMEIRSIALIVKEE